VWRNARMTLLELMIVLAIWRSSWASRAVRRHEDVGESKSNRTRDGEEYAFEAYPSCSSAHPTRPCPDKLEDLNDTEQTRTRRITCGRPVQMLCGRAFRPARRALP